MLNNTGTTSQRWADRDRHGGVCTPTTPTCTGGTIQNTCRRRQLHVHAGRYRDRADRHPRPSFTRDAGQEHEQLWHPRQPGDGLHAHRTASIDGTTAPTRPSPFSDGRSPSTRSRDEHDHRQRDLRRLAAQHPASTTRRASAAARRRLNVTGNNIHDTVGTAPRRRVFVEAENIDNYTVNIAGRHLHESRRRSHQHHDDQQRRHRRHDRRQQDAEPESCRFGSAAESSSSARAGTAPAPTRHNTILRNRQGGAIHMNKGSGTATMSGTVANNTIGTTGVNQSGSIEASGIIIGARGAGGTHTTLIEDNQVFGWTTARSSSRTERATRPSTRPYEATTPTRSIRSTACTASTPTSASSQPMPARSASTWAAPRGRPQPPHTCRQRSTRRRGHPSTARLGSEPPHARLRRRSRRRRRGHQLPYRDATM